MIYLVCFAASAAFAYLANTADNRKKFLFFSFISILLPVLLAGLRDYSIGIDVENYLNKDYYWQGIITHPVGEFLSYYNSLDRGEPLFILSPILLGQLTTNFRVFLFLSHAVIITGVYVGAFRQRKNADPVLVLLLFYLLFFNHSLNIIRQYMAMALIFAFLKDVMDRKYLRYCLVVVVASMIHSASVLALSVPLVHFVLCGNGEDGSYRIGKLSLCSYRKFPLWARQLFIIGGLSLVLALFVPLCRLLLDTGLISRKYNFYLRVDPTDYAGIITLLLVMELVAVFLFRRRMKEQRDAFDFLATGSVIYLILLQMTAFIHGSRRIALFYAFGNLLTLAMLPQSVYLSFLPLKPSTQRRLATVAVVGVALCYWLYFYVLRNASETFPYLSVFSG